MPLPFVPHLTPRDLQLIVFIASGYTNAEIAEAMCLARHTVDSYVSKLLEKSRARNRMQLVMKVSERQERSHRRQTV